MKKIFSLMLVVFLLLLSNCSEATSNESKTEYIRYLCVDTNSTYNGSWFGTGKPFTIIKSKDGITARPGPGFKFDKNLSTEYNYVSINRHPLNVRTFIFNTISESGSIEVFWYRASDGVNGKIYFECKKK
jgi:hypothetical protein